MKRMRQWTIVVGGLGMLGLASYQLGRVTAAQADPAQRGWQKGRGYGWIWGPDDQVGSLNAMTDASRLAALKLVQQGRVYDLGVTYDRTSFKWPGHNPAEIMSYRSPEGVKRETLQPGAMYPAAGAWHSCALFISDNVGTQLDGLGHVTTGADDHWYNGFTEAEHGGDFGLRRCGAETIPPVVCRGVLIDVAGYKNLDALPAGYPVGVPDLRAALETQGTELRPGDAVFIRTGVLRYWGETGADHEKLAAHDTAGLALDGARWLVERHGAMLIGADTSGLECNPPVSGPDDFIPIHVYLLIEQGIHIGELHYLEDLAADKVYEFCYVALVNKIKGATAGFTMRPIAIR